MSLLQILISALLKLKIVQPSTHRKAIIMKIISSMKFDHVAFTSSIRNEQVIGKECIQKSDTKKKTRKLEIFIFFVANPARTFYFFFVNCVIDGKMQLKLNLLELSFSTVVWHAFKATWRLLFDQKWSRNWKIVKIFVNTQIHVCMEVHQHMWRRNWWIFGVL